MKVIGIVGSPRKGMNTDRLVTAALEGAREAGADTDRIYLGDLGIAPCAACGTPPVAGPCQIHDGMERVYSALETVDAIVLGTPAYFGSVSSHVKLMIDRSNCLAEIVADNDGRAIFRSRLAKKKKGVFIWVADLSRDVSHARAMVDLWCGAVNVEIIRVVAFTGSDRPGSADARARALREAYEAGAALCR